MSTLPKPVTSPEYYLVAIHTELQALTAAVQRVAAAVGAPSGVAIDENELRASLMKIKGIGNKTADEVVEYLKGL